MLYDFFEKQNFIKSKISSFFLVAKISVCYYILLTYIFLYLGSTMFEEPKQR